MAAKSAKSPAPAPPVICLFLESHQPHGIAGEYRALDPAIARALASPPPPYEPIVEIIGPPRPRNKHADVGHDGAPDGKATKNALQQQIDDLKAQLTEVVKLLKPPKGG